jgi:hypothetical protein
MGIASLDPSYGLPYELRNYARCSLNAGARQPLFQVTIIRMFWNRLEPVALPHWCLSSLVYIGME